MAHTTQLEEALALALQLAPGDRLRLVERVVASVEHEIAGAPPRQEHWGKHLLQAAGKNGFHRLDRHRYR